MNPLDLLLPYQRAWVEDCSRWKIWLASRQVGKSFAGAAEVALDCQLRPGTHWLLVSAGQRQAQELCAKARQWVRAINLAIARDDTERDGDEFLKAEIVLRNGSRITALPANPDTVRGYSANLFLDEFAFHRDAAALWSAVLPSITNPLRGELRVRICSTPNGQGGAGAMFYRLWSGDAGDVWSRHRTTIHEAVEAGLSVDIAELRRGCADADAWRQEFECEFIDSARVAFPYDLLASCEDEAAGMVWPEGWQPAGPLYAGIDVGSLRDPTVCLTLEDERGDRSRLVVREVLVLEGMQLSDQDALLAPRIRRAARASIDASGLGLDLAQRLGRQFGGKVIAQAITPKWKREAFQALQRALADRRLAIPADRRFRDDLHAYEVHGAGETASFRAPRTDDGHSDIASALAHALDASAAQGSGAWTAEDARSVRDLLRSRPISPRFSTQKPRISTFR